MTRARVSQARGRGTVRIRTAPAASSKPASVARERSTSQRADTRVARIARIPAIDTLRGVAIVAMIGYHFCFDLRWFGVTRWDFEHDIRWLTARAVILSSFLLIAGVSSVLASRQPLPVRHWLRHLALIAAAALLVTAGSALMFPRSFIWFGVLHAIALSLLVAKPFVHRPLLAAIASVVVIAAGVAFANPLFDSRWLGWLGFMTAKPVTEDYVPLFPWMGVLLLGIALGHVLVRNGFAAIVPLAALPAWLRFLGRHSLVVYLVHQPILLGLLALTVG